MSDSIKQINKAGNGFSLMEIMISLVIIAIIAGFGYPRYIKMITRARQTEAKTVLRAIFTTQDLYKMNNLRYADDIKLLDIEVPVNAVYKYSLDPATDNNQTFSAKAEANIDDDPALDQWEINHTNTLSNVINDVLE